MMDILNNISESLKVISAYEAVGWITGIACVWLAAKQNVWTWPLGIVSTGLYVVVFYSVRLYADMGLNAFYFITSIYGWYIWLYGGKNHTGRKVGRVRKKEMLLLSVTGLIFTLGLGYFLENYTDADLSYTDSATTAVSLVGYWMMAKKQIENWVVWLVVDVVYVGVYAYKGLYLTSFLYFIYLILCIKAYADWKEELDEQQKEELAFKL
ncbi:nicotinamide riboside transporter PnuC [Pontibacter silvestris]|uniref:Nicotinamide riboside transporter PnuC n=1 Tax=Pontibacter silvestris TaxID=2305183 RepID=A0ABW4WUM1_9BACT|nr:nicotinamide riboside transporter PnuC [Pontibacter silvestris]MCC9137224.1 nicotinamide riboside transporter PnuC [Pontibacter silvestris]